MSQSPRRCLLMAVAVVAAVAAVLGGCAFDRAGTCREATPVMHHLEGIPEIEIARARGAAARWCWPE